MIDSQQLQRYLGFLDLTQQSPTIDFLCQLQTRHIETVPHENLDALYSIPTTFDIEHLFKAIGDDRYVPQKVW